MFVPRDLACTGLFSAILETQLAGFMSLREDVGTLDLDLLSINRVTIKQTLHILCQPRFFSSSEHIQNKQQPPNLQSISCTRAGQLFLEQSHEA
jgi:hypothetical protein